MENNIEVKVLQTYNDLQLNKIIEVGKKMWINEKRARELDRKKLIKIIQIIKKKEVYS